MVSRRLVLGGIAAVAARRAQAAERAIRIAVAGPMSGAQAWFGEQFLHAADLAVTALNAAGGVLGRSIELITGDDFCDPDQAAALARKLVSDGVVLVVGHYCSHASIAAAKVYEAAGVLQISPGSVSGKLTDEGRSNVFRVCGRDDQQGRKVGDYLAEHWGGKGIALLDDGTAFGAGLANAVRRRLHERGVPVAVSETFIGGKADYTAIISKLKTAGADIFFVGGLHQDTGLFFRAAHEQNYGLRLVAPSSSAAGDFSIIAGPGLEGTLMVAAADMRSTPQAADVMTHFRAQGYDPVGFTLYAYAAVQVWAQAAEAAGSLSLDKVAQTMHRRQFETVLGRIGFDKKGDVTGFDPWQWYIWQADGTYVALEQSEPRE